MKLYNPFTEDLQYYEVEYGKVLASIRFAENDIELYRKMDVDALGAELIENMDQQQDKIEKIIEVEQEQNHFVMQYKSFKKFVSYNPLTFLTTQNIQIRKTVSNLKMVAENKKAEILTIREELTALQKRDENIQNTIKWYGNFDAEKVNRDIIEDTEKLGRIGLERNKVKREWEKVDALLVPLASKIEVLEAEKDKLLKKLTSAQSYEVALNTSANRKSRAIVHDQCFDEFGDGKPHRIVSRLNSELNVINRKLERVEEEAERIASNSRRNF